MTVQMNTASNTSGFTAFGMNFASEREAIIDLIDKIQVVESRAGVALSSWSKTCAIPALRGGRSVASAATKERLTAGVARKAALMMSFSKESRDNPLLP